MDLIYFIEDISKILQSNPQQKKDHYLFLYSILPDSITSKKITIDTKLCKHIIKSGLRRFQSCSKPVIKNSEYCETHDSNIIIQKKKEKKALQQIEEKLEGISLNAKKQIKPTDIILKKNKYNNVLWPNSDLVFASIKQHIIVGYEDELGNICPLDEEHIEECKNYKLKYQKI